MARAALAKGQRVFWAADSQTAIYYGVLREQDRDAGGPQILLYLAPDARQNLPTADLVVLSKPDLYDFDGFIRDFVRRQEYLAAGKFQSFQLWRKPGS